MPGHASKARRPQVQRQVWCQHDLSRNRAIPRFFEAARPPRPAGSKDFFSIVPSSIHTMQRAVLFVFLMMSPSCEAFSHPQYQLMPRIILARTSKKCCTDLKVTKSQLRFRAVKKSCRQHINVFVMCNRWYLMFKKYQLRALVCPEISWLADYI